MKLANSYLLHIQKYIFYNYSYIKKLGYCLIMPDCLGACALHDGDLKTIPND